LIYVKSTAPRFAKTGEAVFLALGDAELEAVVAYVSTLR
jgi:hypothetical protein